MRFLLLILLLVAPNAFAENWAQCRNKVGYYDKDSVVRAGVFSYITVRGSTTEPKKYEYDCPNKERTVPTWGGPAKGPVPDNECDLEVFNFACSKPWEFWKR